MSPRPIDSHCHLDMPQFHSDREQVLERAGRQLAAVLSVCTATPGDNLEDFVRLVDSRSWLYGAVGIHPHDARLASEEFLKEVTSLFSHPRIVGWGEIGLDYHYDHSARDDQRRWFARQIELALMHRLPIIVHSRAAENDILDILERYQGGELSGIFHSFSSGPETAERALALGFYLSFSGMITFKRAEALRQVAAQTPLGRLLVETDAPFLAPEPHRGKRNEPAWVVRVAETVASLHGVDFEDVCRVTTDNFCRLFGVRIEPERPTPSCAQ